MTTKKEVLFKPDILPFINRILWLTIVFELICIAAVLMNTNAVKIIAGGFA